jgi:hypothetical protein
MKSKFTLTALLFLFVALMPAMAQKAKLEDKAKESVTALNTQLTTANPALALSEEQQKAAYEIYLAGESAIAEKRKTVTTDEEKKAVLQPIRKEMNMNVKKNILTKEQRDAIKNAAPKKE